MFQPREIVYGYAKRLRSPHNKYIIIIYQDDNLSIVACFTTSQQRAGVSEEQVHHGPIYNDEKKCISYVFEQGNVIGVNPNSGNAFSFPKRTVVTFDYGIQEGQKEYFFEQFDNPEVVCVLDENEYIELVYAMYCSHYTKTTHKNVLDKILRDYYSKDQS